MVQALVERYSGVRVDALTPEGAPVSSEARGWQARILQHECDHLKASWSVTLQLVGLTVVCFYRVRGTTLHEGKAGSDLPLHWHACRVCCTSIGC
jgi:hypothetical protein